MFRKFCQVAKIFDRYLNDNRAREGSIQFSNLVIVAWCYYPDKQTSKDGQPLEIIDAMSSELHQTAMQTKNDPLAFIKQQSLFGDLAKNNRFTSLYTEMIEQIYKDGDVKKLMQNMI